MCQDSHIAQMMVCIDVLHEVLDFIFRTCKTLTAKRDPPASIVPAVHEGKVYHPVVYFSLCLEYFVARKSCN